VDRLALQIGRFRTILLSLNTSRLWLGVDVRVGACLFGIYIVQIVQIADFHIFYKWRIFIFFSFIVELIDFAIFGFKWSFLSSIINCQIRELFV